MTPTAGLQHIPFQNHCWCDGKGRAEHGETRSSFGLGRLQELEGASRGMGTAPCRMDLGQTQPAGTSPEGSDSLCHKARAEGKRPRVAQRPSPAHGARLELLEAAELLSEGSVLPSVPAAPLTCRPASYKPRQQAASELLRQLQASTWDSSSPSEEPSQGGDPK